MNGSIHVKPQGPAEIAGNESIRALVPRPQGLTAVIPDMPQASAEDIERALTIGDLSKMPADVRIRYYLAACESAGLNALTRPFTPMKTQSGEVVLYANAQAAEQLRKIHRLSMKVLSRVTEDGLYTVTVQGTLPDGREDEAQGIVEVAKLQGMALGNARMKAETKAKRRLTMAMIGLGFALTDDADGHPVRLNTQTGELDGGPGPLPRIETVSREHHIADLTGAPASIARPIPYAETHTLHTHDAVCALDALHVQHQRDADWIRRYWDKMCKRFRVALREELTREHLQGLYAEAEAFYAKHPSTVPQAEAVATDAPLETPESPPGHPTPNTNGAPPLPSGAWREMLAGLLGDLEDATVAQEAGSMLEDPDVTDADGHAMVTRVLRALDNQDGTTFPF